MKFFLDTASLKDISWAAQAGLIDGITTNPTLLSKQSADLDPRDVLKEICSLVEGPVSAEVVAVDTEGMLKEGKELAKIADNIVVKIPMLEEGMVAVRRLAAEGIRTNVTLCFSSVQCLIAAKAGASYVSPFIGRLDDGEAVIVQKERVIAVKFAELRKDRMSDRNGARVELIESAANQGGGQSHAILLQGRLRRGSADRDEKSARSRGRAIPLASAKARTPNINGPSQQCHTQRDSPITAS